MAQFVSSARPRYEQRHDYQDLREPFGLVEYRALLLGPGGVEFDITDRLGSSGLAQITGSTEENFLEFTHGDADLEVMDEDVAVEQFFAGVEATDLYEIIIDRFTGSRRNRWERIFAGTLDLPWSIRINRRDRTVSLQAFSYSKLLEKFSAENVRRALTGRTGSVTSGSRNVTVSSSTDMLVGDTLELKKTDGTAESQVISRISSATLVTTVNTWSQTFPSGTPLNILTPYHRDSSVSDLAVLVFKEAGILSSGIDLSSPLSEFPIPTPISKTGFNTVSSTGLLDPPHCGTQRGSIFRMPTGTGVGALRFEASGPGGPWTQFTTDTGRFTDWTAYFDAEPANFRAITTQDDGTWEITNHDNNDLWELAAGATGDLPSQPINGLGIFKNNTSEISYIETPTTPNTTNVYHSIERDPVSGKIWVSVCGNGSLDPVTGRNYDCVGVWDGVSVTDISTNGLSGQLRYLRRLKLMVLHERDAGATGGGAQTTNLHIYDPATLTKLRIVTVPEDLWAWSLRVVDFPGNQRRIVGLYVLNGKTRARIWDEAWVQVADYEIVAKAPAATNVIGYRAFLSVFTDLVGNEMVFGYVGDEMFVIGKGYLGVVPYADFDGLSCGAALKELALVSMSYIDVEDFKVGTLRGRSAQDLQGKSQAIPIDEPLERTSWLITEFFRTSARITGEDSSGNDIEVIVGDTGDSNHRLDLDSKLIRTAGLAEAIGNQYVAFLKLKRRQEELKVAETGTLLPVGSYLDFDGAVWRVIESTLDVINRAYTLRALEA